MGAGMTSGGDPAGAKADPAEGLVTEQTTSGESQTGTADAAAGEAKTTSVAKVATVSTAHHPLQQRVCGSPAVDG